jgi:hypothetical protein
VPGTELARILRPSACKLCETPVTLALPCLPPLFLPSPLLACSTIFSEAEWNSYSQQTVESSKPLYEVAHVAQSNMNGLHTKYSSPESRQNGANFFVEGPSLRIATPAGMTSRWDQYTHLTLTHRTTRVVLRLAMETSGSL